MSSELQGRPTAAELIEAVAEFLSDTLAPDVPSQHAFHLRVAINALGMVARELNDDGVAERGHVQRLATLGVVDDADLARRIRAGSAPDGTWAAVLADVEARVDVGNPAFVERYRP